MNQQTTYPNPATAPPPLREVTGLPTDAELGRMVREGCYVRGASFGPGEKQSRFLLVFAVPYGPDDFDGETPTVRQAIEAAHEFLSDSDSFERQWQVFDACGDASRGEPRFMEVSLENLPEESEPCECGRPAHTCATFDGADEHGDRS